MQIVPTPPDRAAFEADLRKPAFRAGEVAGAWRLATMAWPHAIIMVAAAERPGAPREYAFRFDLAGYPAIAPTAGPWDAVAGIALPPERWPVGTGVFASVFRIDWMYGSCLYLPCDRISAKGHPMWVHQHPDRIWNASRGIVHYLEQIHALLTEGGYSGVRRA